MFNFELKKTAIYRAVKWEKWPIFKFAKFFEKLFLILFVIFFLIFLYGFVPENFSQAASKKLLGLSTIFLVCYLSARIKGAFFNLKLKNSKPETTLSEVILNPEDYNLAEFLSFEAAKAVKQAIDFSRRRKLSKVYIFQSPFEFKRN